MVNIAIVGMGLIGGSLGMALRGCKARGKRLYHVTGIGRDTGKLASALELGAADRVTTDWPEGVREADIVVLCTPVDLVSPSIKRLLTGLKPGVILTDAGSVKGPVIRSVRTVLNQAYRSAGHRPSFIGAHPMAGAEKSGIRHARADLYRGAAVVLTPEARSSRRALEAVRALWNDAGARTFCLDAGRHDRIVSVISHLPHILSFTLSSSAGKLQKKEPLTARLLAGSFRDMTRVADSNPGDWAVICHDNRNAVRAALGRYIEALTGVRRNLPSAARLEKIFAAGSNERKRLAAMRGWEG